MAGLVAVAELVQAAPAAEVAMGPKGPACHCDCTMIVSTPVKSPCRVLCVGLRGARALPLGNSAWLKSLPWAPRALSAAAAFRNARNAGINTQLQRQLGLRFVSRPRLQS